MTNSISDVVRRFLKKTRGWSSSVIKFVRIINMFIASVASKTRLADLCLPITHCENHQSSPAPLGVLGTYLSGKLSLYSEKLWQVS